MLSRPLHDPTKHLRRQQRQLPDPAGMSAAQINKELDRLEQESSAITTAFIEAGRGRERPSDYLKLTDPLSLKAKENSDRLNALRIEVELRYGGRVHRLPRGFGPINR